VAPPLRQAHPTTDELEVCSSDLLGEIETERYDGDETTIADSAVALTAAAIVLYPLSHGLTRFCRSAPAPLETVRELPNLDRDVADRHGCHSSKLEHTRIAERPCPLGWDLSSDNDRATTAVSGSADYLADEGSPSTSTGMRRKHDDPREFDRDRAAGPGRCESNDPFAGQYKEPPPIRAADSLNEGTTGGQLGNRLIGGTGESRSARPGLPPCQLGAFGKRLCVFIGRFPDKQGVAIRSPHRLRPTTPFLSGTRCGADEAPPGNRF